MEDPNMWEIEEESCLSVEEEGKSKVGWILEKGINLGKKVVISGILVSSAPVILPPFVVISALGFAVSVPFGLYYASYACTEKIMSKLLPGPRTPLLWGSEAVIGDEQEEEQEIDFGGEDLEQEEREQIEDTTKGVEMRVELVIEGDRADKDNAVDDVEGDDDLKQGTTGLQEKLRDEGGAVDVVEEEKPQKEEGGAVDVVVDDKENEEEKPQKDEGGAVDVVEDDKENEEENPQKDDKLEKLVEELKKKEEDQNEVKNKQGQEERELLSALETSKSQSASTKKKGRGGKKSKSNATRKPEVAAVDINKHSEDASLRVEKVAQEVNGRETKTRDDVHIRGDKEIKGGKEGNLGHAKDESDIKRFSSRETEQHSFEPIEEHVTDKRVSSREIPEQGAVPETKHGVDVATPKRKVVISEEKMWEQIDALRTIVGYKAPLHPSCVEELNALYVFTGVEPPPCGDHTDLTEINTKLRFLMSIVGVK